MDNFDDPTPEQREEAQRRHRVEEQRGRWWDLFSSIIMNACRDSRDVRGLAADPSRLVESARAIADAALDEMESRYPGYMDEPWSYYS